MSGTDRPTRRAFLQGAGAAALAAPTILSAASFGDDKKLPPSDRITLGFIGVGKMNGDHLKKFLDRPATQVLAVCDVDTTRRENARKTVEDAYAKNEKSGYK